MRSSFFELNVAMSGLFTARGGLNTVSNNIANASTVGYSRQVVEQRASTPIALNSGRGMVGTGSEIYGIKQIRDFYLDKKYWNQNAVLGRYSVVTTQLSLTQAILNEMKGTGLSAQFNDFFNRLQDLSTTAGDSTYRTNLTQLGDAISTYFNNTYESFKKQQRDINDEIDATVTIINSLGQQIQSLNKQISQFEISGSAANELRDQRALLVDQLSRYVNVEVKEYEANQDYAAGKYPAPEDRGKSDKRFVVMINGQEFVNHFSVNLLETKERKYMGTDGIVNLHLNPEDNDGLYDIYWKGSDAKFNVYHPNLTGELRGLIDMRDGNNGNFVAKAPYVSYTGNVLTLSLDPANTRVDLSPNGGVISLLDKTTGQTKEVYYSSYTYDPSTKEGKFTICGPSDTSITAADFDPANNKEINIGQTTNYKGVAYYMSRLNDLARTFAMAINEGKYIDGTPISYSSDHNVMGHVDSYDFYGNKGQVFFTYKDRYGTEVGYGQFNVFEINAGNFFVNSNILKDPKLLAASIDPAKGESNNEAILSWLQLKTDRNLFLEGTLTDYIIGVSGEMGVDMKQAQNFQLSYKDMTVSIDNQRMSVSGVDLNEELTNMIKYQQQYQAAARLINIIDGIYDTMINRLGSF